MILYILILICAFQVVNVLVGMIKERRKRKEDLESWKRFKK